ncbi:MAG: hypothetical protein A4E64_03119 [Syntrophorhabdus sp. PtaU1.Bin058]|nr:MAG: hypothetical protein A4E64_03119 [Syntrophorhabdus sp. PtaU1.Bin058]
MIPEQELNKGLLTMKIIWFGMLMSLAIYLFMGLQLATGLKSSIDKDNFAILRMVLYAVAFVTLIATRYIRRLVLYAKGKYRQSAQTPQHPVLQRYVGAMVVSLALSESIGIYGLVLFLLGKNTIDLYLPILVSAAAMVMYRPRKDELLSMAQDMEDSATGGTMP